MHNFTDFSCYGAASIFYNVSTCDYEFIKRCFVTYEVHISKQNNDMFSSVCMELVFDCNEDKFFFCTKQVMKIIVTLVQRFSGDENN
jgi:hypothetical protein